MSRGGARNRADRRTLTIPTDGALNVHAAAWFAREIGLALNRHTTIHWERAGVADSLGATLRFLELASAWVRSRGEAFACVWVRETGPGKGEHVHILMRVPPVLADDFKRRQRGWLKACGAAWRAGVVRSERIGYSLRHADQGGYARPTRPICARCWTTFSRAPATPRGSCWGCVGSNSAA